MMDALRYKKIYIMIIHFRKQNFSLVANEKVKNNNCVGDETKSHRIKHNK